MAQQLVFSYRAVDDAESEASANSDADDGPPAQESRCLQETLVATDPMNDGDPAACFSVMRTRLQLVAEQTQKIAAAEKHVQVECRDGTRINIRDVGGRERAAHLLRSMHESSKNFNDRDKQRLASGVRGRDHSCNGRSHTFGFADANR